MKKALFVAATIGCCITSVPTLVTAQDGSSRTQTPAKSTSRSSVPTGAPLSDRKAIDEEKSSAPPPPPRVKDGNSGVPVIPAVPVAPAGN